MSNEQKLREALQALLASGGVIAEATADELQAAIDDPDAEEIVKVQAAAVLNARQALATTEPVMANGLTEAETDATASVMGLATTEPEPKGMPELPEPHAVITGKLGTHCSFNSSHLRKGDAVYTADQMRAAIKQGVK